MKKKIALLKEVGIMTGLLSGAIASCAGPAFLGIVLGGILTNAFSNKIEKSDLKKIKASLFGGNQNELNHDIEELIQKSMIWATNNICYSYKTYCSTKKDKKTLKEIRRFIIEKIENIDKSQWEASNELIEQIDGVSVDTFLIEDLVNIQLDWPEININKPFPDYYKERFIESFKLCFGELLKDPHNIKALRAYQRNITNSIQSELKRQSEKLDKILSNNYEIKKELLKISNSSIGHFEQNYIVPEIDIVLENYLKPMHDDILLLVGLNGEVLVGINKIKKENEYQTQKIEQLGIEIKKSNRFKLLIPIMAFPLGLFIAYLSYNYWLSMQPYVLTVNVKNGSSNKYLPFEQPKVKIISNNTSQTIQTQNNRAVFGGLPSNLRRDSIRIQIETHGFRDIDTIVNQLQNLNITLTRDDTYRWKKGRVTDRSNNNLPVGGAMVKIENITTFTGPDGLFVLEIPENLQKDRHRLEVSKDGYETLLSIEEINGALSLISLKQSKK